jgi:hypothetical protein
MARLYRSVQLYLQPGKRSMIAFVLLGHKNEKHHTESFMHVP